MTIILKCFRERKKVYSFAMSIYLTRHGFTPWNEQRRIQGRYDIPLNEEGIRQAEQLAEQMKDIHLDRIISSPLNRALHTAKIVNQYHNLPIETDPRIIEEYYGRLEGKPRSGDVYLNQRKSFFKRYPEGEGYLDVCYRIYDFLHELERISADKDILVVAHGGISRVFHSYFRDMENEEFVTYGIDNCELVKYEFPHRDFPLIKEEE